MAILVSLGYGVAFALKADFDAAVALNSGSITLNMTPETATATFPAGQMVQAAPPFFSAIPGIVTLGTYTPVFGTPGITYAPNTISTATLTTSVTETIYGSFSNVMAVYGQSYTWVGVLYFLGSPLPPFPTGTFTGKWQQQVLTYTGDGNAGHLIPTTFSLATGVVVVRIFPKSNSPTCRHNGQTGSTESASVQDVGKGVVSFGTTGFTVTDDLGQLVDVNQSGHSYTAIVLSDTTSDNRYMRVGSYPGDAAASKAITVGAAPLQQITQLWIFGRSGTGVFYSDDFAAGTSFSWAAEAKTVTNQVLSVGLGTFTVGNDNNVNNAGISSYFYVAFSIPGGNPIRNIFQTFKSPVGTGASVNVSLNFTPTFAEAREYTVGVPITAWRGPLQTGTISTSYVGIDVASGDIEALGTNQLTLGATILPNTEFTYGFAMKTGSVLQPPIFFPPEAAPPPFIPGTPINYVNTGGYTIQWLLEEVDVKYRREENL